MGSLNKVMLIGYVGKDPELRYTAGNTAVASFSLATTDKWTKNGKKENAVQTNPTIKQIKATALTPKYSLGRILLLKAGIIWILH